MINRVVLVGRLTRDPELRKTPNGASVASFTVAIDNRRGPNGEKTTSFIPCVVWNQQAENAYKFIHKGSLVGIDGRLNQRSYDTKDGRKANVIEVICDSVQFLEPKSSSLNREETDYGYTPDAETNNNLEERQTSSIDVNDDDLPF